MILEQETVEDLICHLEGWANQLVARFGHPVYLVGSALENGKRARDIDIVVILPDTEFWGRYGSHSGHESMAPNWPIQSIQYASDMAKLSSWAAAVLKINIDLKVMPACIATIHHHGKPRLRLDKIDVPEVPLYLRSGCDCELCKDKE